MATSPAERAASVVGAISVVRQGRSACELHARHLRTGHVMQLDAMELAHEQPVAAEAPLAGSAAELSDLLLTAVFGSRPARQAPDVGARTRRKAGVVVRELSWAAWTAALETERADTCMPDQE